MNRHLALIMAASLGLAGCGNLQGPLAMQAAAAKPDWREIATDSDRTRLRGWRETWTVALDAVRKAGQGAALSRSDALFDPDRALAEPAPPPGDYRCSWFKLGANGPAMADFTTYPASPCRVAPAGKALHFTMLGGPQRPQGLIFDDETARAVFLGTLVLDDEAAPIDYGRDEQRDMAGYVERIGDRQWRLVLPRPYFESTLDVIELVPAA
jgi:hypothetical protein